MYHSCVTNFEPTPLPTYSRTAAVVSFLLLFTTIFIIITTIIILFASDFLNPMLHNYYWAVAFGISNMNLWKVKRRSSAVTSTNLPVLLDTLVERVRIRKDVYATTTFKVLPIMANSVRCPLLSFFDFSAITRYSVLIFLFFVCSLEITAVVLRPR